jgi:hypothetical protein
MKKSLDFLKKVDGQPAVYVITSKELYQSDPTNKQLVKIGLADDLNKRLNSYLLYWPNGVHIFDIFYTNKLQCKRLERSIHEYLNVKSQYIVTLHSHGEEWFNLTRIEIQQLIDVVIANASTRNPFDHFVSVSNKKVNMKGRLIFPFHSHESLDFLLVANLTRGTDRIKPMYKSLKMLLDAQMKGKPVPTTVKKPKKKSKKKIATIPFKLD